MKLRDEQMAARMRELGVGPLPGTPAESQTLPDPERRIRMPLIRDLQVSLD
jgi:hypothetical protein